MPWSAGLAKWLQGELDLRVTVPNAAEFLGLLLEGGVPFRHARVGPDTLRLRIRLRDFRRIRPAAFRSRARVRIRRRLGAPFLLVRLRRRPFLAGAAVSAAVLLYALSGFVWFVQVRGSDRVDPAEILHAAASLGLRSGVWRAAVDPGSVARRLPLAVPDLSWAAVTVQGTLAIIQVVERQRPRPAYEQAMVAGDVVAAHDGIVTGMTVNAGEALVAPGDAVRSGQVLIRGVVGMPASRASGSALRETPVHASGVVIATRWYSMYAEVPQTISVGVPTGRVQVRRSVIVGRFHLDLPAWGRLPFGAYTLQRQVSRPLRWRNIPLPVEFATLRYAEVRYYLRRLSVTSAGDMAAAEARAFLIPHLPPQARIIEERQRVFSLPGNRVGVELQVESEDNIGVFRPAAPAAALEPPPPASGAGGMS